MTEKRKAGFFRWVKPYRLSVRFTKAGSKVRAFHGIYLQFKVSWRDCETKTTRHKTVATWPNNAPPILQRELLTLLGVRKEILTGAKRTVFKTVPPTVVEAMKPLPKDLYMTYAASYGHLPNAQRKPAYGKPRRADTAQQERLVRLFVKALTVVRDREADRQGKRKKINPRTYARYAIQVEKLQAWLAGSLDVSRSVLE